MPPTGLPNTFTATGNLGPESGEVYPNYDDIDDFNGFTDIIQTPRADFAVTIAVGYVTESMPDSVYVTPSFYKKMTVNVTNAIISSYPISADYIFGYWGETP